MWGMWECATRSDGEWNKSWLAFPYFSRLLSSLSERDWHEETLQYYNTAVLSFVALEPNSVCHHLVCEFCPVALFVPSLLLSRARICVCCHGEGCARMFVLLMKTNERENKTEKQHTHMHTHLCTIGKKRITQENKFTRRARVHTLTFTQKNAH